MKKPVRGALLAPLGTSQPNAAVLRRAREPSTARLATPASIIAQVEVSGTLPAPVRNTPEADVKVTPGGKSIVIGSVMSAELVKKDEAKTTNSTSICLWTSMLTVELMKNELPTTVTSV